MRPELIDYLRGELDEAAAEALRREIAGSEELQQELNELQGLRSLMRRLPEIQPTAAFDRAVLAALVAAPARKSPWARVRERVAFWWGLARYRFRTSTAFRVSAVSVGAHLAVLAVLYPLLTSPKVEGDASRPVGIADADAQMPAGWAPNPERLGRRFSSRSATIARKLQDVGLSEHAAWIRSGVERLTATQQADGSFGDLRRTGRAALVLLAEGAHSAGLGPSSEGVRRARRVLLERSQAGPVPASAVQALLEDYVLSFESTTPDERLLYASRIQDRIQRMAPDDDRHEALAVARMARFGVQGEIGEGFDLLIQERSREGLLERAPTRSRLAAAFARGPGRPSLVRLREWARPLLEKARARLAQTAADAEALLILQSPYRF